MKSIVGLVALAAGGIALFMGLKKKEEKPKPAIGLPPGLTTSPGQPTGTLPPGTIMIPPELLTNFPISPASVREMYTAGHGDDCCESCANGGECENDCPDVQNKDLSRLQRETDRRLRLGR